MPLSERAVPMHRNLERFARQGLTIALDMQPNLKNITFKDPSQPVTPADIAISKLLIEIFGTENVLEEETIQNATFAERKKILARKGLIISDPIDGTKAYILGMPRWGVTAGWYDEGMPIAGVSGLPLRGDDRERSAVILASAFGGLKWAMRSKEGRYYLNGNNWYLNKLASSGHAGHHLEQGGVGAIVNLVSAAKDVRLLRPVSPTSYYGAVHGIIDGFALERISAAIVQLAIYDLGGVMATLPYMGLEMTNLETGEVFTRWKADHFNDKWKMLDPWIICRPGQATLLRPYLKVPEKD